MKRKNMARNALFTSIISLLLCVSMLVGTTFAWFTDSVVSGSNVIASGNLDIEVQYTLDGTNWADLNGANNLFQKSLWEPGHTEVVALKIENKGSLALKYVANMNIVEEIVGKSVLGNDIVLSDILTVSTLTTVAEDVAKAFASENGVTYGSPVAFKSASVLESNANMLPDTTQYVIIKVDMAETVGNEANHNGVNKPSINFGINILATQYTHEEDSFDNQYDVDATFPKVPVTVTDKEEDKEAAVKDPTETVMVKIPADEPAGEYHLEVGPKSFNTSEDGKTTTVSMEIDLYKDGEKVTGEYPTVVNLGAGLQGLEIIHKTEKITNFNYNPVTGVVDFVTSYSPFSFSYEKGDYAVATTSGTYDSLAAAFAAAKDEDVIALFKDLEISEGITNTKKITLDLNGHTIIGTDNSNGSFAIITNKGELTVTGGGKMTLTATNDREWNAYSSVISNTVGGKLTVENGTFEHLGGTDMAYAIDNLTNGKGTYAEVVINGGLIKSTYRAVRMFLNGTEAQNILTVNGGTIEGTNKSIWMQDPSANANTGTLTVKKDATLNGDVYLFVCAGSTEWPVTVSIADAAVKGEVLSGNVPAGYAVVKENNVWTVVKADETKPADLPKASVSDYTDTKNIEWGSYGQWSPTEGLDANLEAAYTLACTETAEEAAAGKYADWYCDFYVSLNKDLGANQIFLGGNYGSFGWVGFHNGDVTLKANEELPLLGSVTQNPWTYMDVINNVGTFICGVGDVDNALTGATFSVKLRLTNPQNEAEFYDIETINYTFR